MRISNKDGNVFGELDSLPGSSQVVVSHSVYALERGVGNGKKAHQERITLMQSLGWNYALCTVAHKNEAQIAILEANRWKRLDFFSSDKTGNLVYLYGRALQE